MIPLPFSSCFIHFLHFLFLPKSLGSFPMFLTLVQTLIRLIHMLPSVFLLVILKLKKGIMAIVLFFDATLWVMMSVSLSSSLFLIYIFKCWVWSFTMTYFYLFSFTHPLTLDQPSLVPSVVPLQVYSCHLWPLAPMPSPTLSTSSNHELPILLTFNLLFSKKVLILVLLNIQLANFSIVKLCLLRSHILLLNFYVPKII